MVHNERRVLLSFRHAQSGEEAFLSGQGQSWTLRYSLAVLSTPADHARLAEIVAAFKSKNS
jgi:hypothetical protein